MRLGVLAAAAVALLVAWNPIVELPRLRLNESIGAAYLLAREQRPAEAAAEIEAVLPAFAEQPGQAAYLHRYAARCWRMAGRRDKAQRHLERAAELLGSPEP